jgi:hypothetical protein
LLKFSLFIDLLIYFRSQIQSSKPSEHLKNNNRSTPVSLSLSKTSGNNGAISANSSNEHSTPRPPSEEFLKWCRQALRGLNDVNGKIKNFLFILSFIIFYLIFNFLSNYS